MQICTKAQKLQKFQKFVVVVNSVYLAIFNLKQTCEDLSIDIKRQIRESILILDFHVTITFISLCEFKIQNIMLVKKKHSFYKKQLEKQLEHFQFMQAIRNQKKIGHKYSKSAVKSHLRYDANSLLIQKYRKISKQNIQLLLARKINSLLHNQITTFTTSIKQAIINAGERQFLTGYFNLSKNIEGRLSSSLINQNFTIEQNLLSVIQQKKRYLIEKEPFLDLTINLYKFMKDYQQKKKRYRKKMESLRVNYQQNLEIKQNTGKNTLTLSLSHKKDNNIAKFKEKNILQKEQRYEKTLKKAIQQNTEKQKQLNTSESRDIQLLSECIKEMFLFQENTMKKVKLCNGDEIVLPRKNQTLQSFHIQMKSNRDQRHSRSKSPNYLQCQLSSIAIHSNIQNYEKENQGQRELDINAEENYGLGELKRKFQEQKKSKIKCQSLKFPSEISNIHHHKRNPTEIYSQSKNNFYNEQIIPMRVSQSKTACISTKKIPDPSPNKQKIKQNLIKKIQILRVKPAGVYDFESNKTQRRKQNNYNFKKSQKENVQRDKKSKDKVKLKSKNKN